MEGAGHWVVRVEQRRDPPADQRAVVDDDRAVRSVHHDLERRTVLPGYLDTHKTAAEFLDDGLDKRGYPGRKAIFTAEPFLQICSEHVSHQLTTTILSRRIGKRLKKKSGPLRGPLSTVEMIMSKP